jgi:hypothetical protein
MPRELPHKLKPLLERQALELSDRHWKQDLEILARALETIPGIARHVQELGSDGGARAIYRPLVADLDGLDRALRGLADLSSSPVRDLSLVLAQLHMVEVAADPVCQARRSVSQLDDAGIRNDLDAICTAVEVLKALAQHTDTGAGAAALARVLEDSGRVKQLRDKLLPRI